MQKVNKLKGKQQLQETEDMIAYETMEAFFNVLYSMDLVKLSEQQLVESSTNLKQVKRMEELGLKGSPDIAEMAAKEASDNYSLTKQNNILLINIIKLKEKMNFPIDEDLKINDTDNSILITKSQDTAFDIFERSKSFLPKAIAAESALQAQRLSHKSVKGTLYPTISADAGYFTNFSRYMDGSDYASFSNQIKNKVGRYVGFSLRIPIFNGFSRSAEVKRSKAELIIAQSERDETLRLLYSEIEQAVADMNGQADEYYQAKKQVEAMDIAHQVNQRKYTEGLISAIDLNTSANRLTKAKAEELNSKLKFQLKHKLVNYYKGEPFVTINE